MGEEKGSCNLEASVPLLDVLAEVASAQLKSDPVLSKKKVISGSGARKNVKKVEVLTLDQIRVLSDKMLLEMFSELKCDEIRRHFSYTCYLVPDKCSQVFNSFGSENKARLQMKAHLLTHIAELLAEANAPGKSHRAKFTAEPLQARRRRLQENDTKKKKRGRAKSQTKRATSSSKKNTPPSEKSPRPDGSVSSQPKKYTSLKSKKNNLIPASPPKELNSLTVGKTNSNTDKVAPPIVYGRKSSPAVAKASQKQAGKNRPKVGKLPRSSKLSLKKASTTSNNHPKKGTSLSSTASTAGKKKSGLKNSSTTSDDLYSQDQNSDSGKTASKKSASVKKVKVKTGKNARSNDSSINTTSNKQLPMLAQVACHSKPYVISSSASKPLLHDHCYTSPAGKKDITSHEVISSKVNNEFKSPKGAIPDEAMLRFAVATPAFPQVYVPLLPNASEVIEIAENGAVSKFPMGGSSQTVVSSKRDSPTIGEDSRPNKKTKIRTINKIIIPEELDPDSEENGQNHEVAVKELTSFHVPNGMEICNVPENQELENSIKVVMDGTKNISEWERKLAIRCIRALRNKKKEDRGPLVCKICRDKTFTAQATLMYHYRSHAGIKPFTCNICRATFTRQHSLNYHMLIHNNKSRFVCGDCGRNFRHPSHFKEHQRRHTGETPYECGDCGFRFKTRNTYKRHLKTRHGKMLTAQGIRQLTIEEFCKVRTTPRKKVPKSPISPSKKKDQETQWPDGFVHQIGICENS